MHCAHGASNRATPSPESEKPNCLKPSQPSRRHRILSHSLSTYHNAAAAAAAARASTASAQEVPSVPAEGPRTGVLVDHVGVAWRSSRGNHATCWSNLCEHGFARALFFRGRLAILRSSPILLLWRGFRCAAAVRRKEARDSKLHSKQRGRENRHHAACVRTCVCKCAHVVSRRRHCATEQQHRGT